MSGSPVPVSRFSTRRELEAFQLSQLNKLLAEILPSNRFYQSKFHGLSDRVTSLDAWARYPTTTKFELSTAADERGLAPHHTYSLNAYTRLHRTSGSTGRPLIVMDRPEDWQWWMDVWQDVLQAADLKPGDAIFMAFSFGPFIGFWSATEACLARGCRVIPGGGLSTAARIDLIQDTRCDTLFTTPSYAMHLAAEAEQRGIAPRSIGLRRIIVAGEPGGSIPEVRQRIESTYQAKLLDHAGATEVGPWGFGTTDGSALEIIERAFIAEFLPLESCSTTQPELRELVLTGLGRTGAPILRYRTGDIVRPEFGVEPDGNNVRLAGGILGRVDQMLTIRGVNIIPSSIEALLRSIPEIVEFRLTADRHGEMDRLTIEVEDTAHQPKRISDLFDRRLGLRVEIVDVESNSLPRFQDKAKRFVDRRNKS
jgi:phenylacetate-CoA ligase